MHSFSSRPKVKRDVDPNGWIFIHRLINLAIEDIGGEGRKERHDRYWVRNCALAILQYLSLATTGMDSARFTPSSRYSLGSTVHK